MVIYGMIIAMMVDKIMSDCPGYLQSWYADDFIPEGEGAHIKPSIFRIEALGTAHEFFLEQK